MKLSKKQQVWRFIKSEIRDTGLAPTFPEMAKKFKFKHKQQVSYYTRQFKALGLITTVPRLGRSIKLTKKGKTYEFDHRV